MEKFSPKIAHSIAVYLMIFQTIKVLVVLHLFTNSGISGTSFII